MADVITRFKLETTQYDSKLRDASQQLAQYARQASFAGNEFQKFTRDQVEAARAFGNIATSANNSKDKVRELVGAYNEAARAYNALTKEQQQSDWGNALAESMNTLKGRIGEAKQELYSMGDSGKSTSGIMDVLNDKFTINIDALKLFNAGMTAAKAALDVAKDAFFSCETNVDDWGRTVAATEGIYQSFLQTINSGNFSGFLSGIQQVIDKAKEAYNAMDELNTRMTIINPERAKLQTRATELKAIIRREGKDSEAGKAAQEALRALEPAMSKAFEKESRLNYNAFRSQVDAKLAEAGIKLSKYSPIYQMLMQSFSNDDLYNEFRKRGKGSITTEFKNYNNNGTSTTLLSGGYSQKVDTRNLEQKLLDLFTDEWRKTYSPYLTASFTAKGAAASVLLSDARYLKEGGGGGGSTGGTTRTAATITPGSVADYTNQIKNLRAEQLQVTSPEAWMGLQQQIEHLNVLIKELKGELKVEPYNFGSDTSKRADNYWGELEKKFSNPDKIISEPLSRIVNNINRGQGKSSEFPQELSKITGGVSSIVGGIQQLGLDVPESMQKMIALMQGMNTILTGIMALTSIIEVNSTTQAAASVVNALTPFHFGGVVHAANGFAGKVPGTAYSGDNIPALLDAGEVVLTRAMAGNVASQLEGNNLGNLQLEAVIYAEQLRFLLRNNSKRRGKGEYVTSKMRY